jgi:hypothetical protein
MILPRQMQKHGAAAPGNAWPRVVVDLDNEIVETIGARQAVTAAIRRQPHRLVIMPVAGVFAPGVLGLDPPYRQVRPWPDVAVGAPPQLPRAEGASRGPAIALALVGEDAAPSQRHRDR